MNQLFQQPPLDNEKLVDLLNILTSNNANSTNETLPSSHHQVYTNLIKSLLSLVSTLYMPLVQQNNQISNPPTPPLTSPSSSSSFKSKNHHTHHQQNHLAKSKLVRGQEEWVNSNARNSSNNFLSQVLKCMECSASFESLSDLSVHMVNSQHYSKFFEHPITTNHHHNHHNQSSSLGLAQITQNQSFPPHPLSPYQLKSKTKTSSTSINSTIQSGNGVGNGLPSKCEICLKSVTNTHLPPLVELIQHLKNEHDITNVCTNCGAFFANHADLKSHLIEEQHYHHHHNHHNHSMVNPKNYNHYQNSKKLKYSNFNNHRISTSTIQQQQQSKLFKSTTAHLGVNIHSPSNLSNCSSSTNSPPPIIPPSTPTVDSLPSKSSNQHHHPLLALQMFVNGTNDISSASVTMSKPSSNLLTEPTVTAASMRDIKLPAKKRPYRDEDLNEEELSSFSSEDFDEAKSLKKIKLDIKREKVEPDEKKKKLEEEEDEEVENNASSKNDRDMKLFQQKQKPLHLLERMHLNLDNYLLS